MLNNQSILITGAASGIGSAAARLFAGYGAQVTLVDRSAGVLDVAQAVGGAGVIADVTDAAAMRDAVEAALARFGRLDGAFNNAGTEQAGAAMIAVGDYPLGDFDRVIAINLRGMLVSMQAELAVMVPAGRGAIVNTSSVMGWLASAGMAAYVASKHGAVGLTKAAALDYAARGIRVNAILPGAVRTPMLTERAFPANPGYEAVAGTMHPIGRLAEPHEIAEAAAWLLSDRASFVTGATLAVDGGFSAM